jgi:hypothetical protein
MRFPVLGILGGKGLIADEQEVFRVFLLGHFGEVKAPVMMVSPSMTMILRWAMACSVSIMVGTP